MVEQQANEISLSDIAAVLGRHTRLLVTVPLAMLVLAVIYLHLSEPKYAVTLKVTPTSSAQSALPIGLTGLADLTGLAIPAGNETVDFELYLEGLQARETSAAVTRDQALLRRLFADQWDEEAGEWIEPGGLMRGTAGVIKAVVGVPGQDWRPPGAETVNEFLDEELVILRDRTGPVVSIMIEHSRPEVAQALLALLHQTVDSALRQKELDRTGAYVAYLKDQLANVSVTEYRQALHDILAEQEKRRMVASSTLPFAAEPFGEPTISVRPTSPRPLLTIVSSVLFGILLGIVIALSLHQVRRQQRQAK